MFRIGLTLGLTLAVAGCASSVGNTLDVAPDWFEERRSDLSHDGYPSLQTASQLSSEISDVPWVQIQQDLSSAQAKMDMNDPGPVTITAEDMRSWAEEQIRLVDKGEEPY